MIVCVVRHQAEAKAGAERHAVSADTTSQPSKSARAPRPVKGHNEHHLSVTAAAQPRNATRNTTGSVRAPRAPHHHQIFNHTR